MKVPRWTPTTPIVIAARHAWVKTMVATIPDQPANLPTYGSPHWAALADDDPRKLAAAVIAAECWATDLDELPTRLHDELAASTPPSTAAREDYWSDTLRRRRQGRSRRRHTGRVRDATPLRQPQAQRVTEARRPRPGDRPARQPATSTGTPYRTERPHERRTSPRLATAPAADHRTAGRRPMGHRTGHPGPNSTRRPKLSTHPCITIERPRGRAGNCRGTANRCR